MSVYFYKAINKSGILVTGHLESSSKHDISALLRQRGLTLINITANSRIFRAKRIDLQLFFEQLTVLLNQRITLQNSLDIMITTANDAFSKRVIAEVLFDMTQGNSFSYALGNVPGMSAFVIDMVRHAEQSGNLEKICAMLSAHFKAGNLLVQQQRRAVTYPICVLIAIMSFLIIALRGLVPNVKSFLGDAAAQSAIFCMSDLSIRHPYWCALCAAAVLGGAILLLQKLCRTNNSVSYHGLLWLNTLALLLQSGVSLKNALILSKEQTKSIALKKSIECISQRIINGAPLHSVFQRIRVVPPSAAKFAEIGEACGLLGEMLAQGAQLEMQRALARMQRRIALLQPALLGLFGLILVWLILAIFWPIYNNLQI
ncbi:MAG: type II secretion system F family protein [Holosporales bacterium]|jgi:type II secretory pathway component PulF|nr:type II secretion system F family protein [Holosporales bacterium]